MPYQLGDSVPAFALPRVEGGELRVDPAASSATVVVFTSNSCPYAVAWHDRLQQVARDFADRGVAVVQINPNRTNDRPQESAEAGAARVARGDFAGPYLRDETQAVARDFGAEKTPDVFVLDGAGRLVYRGAPDADYEDEAAAASYLREALAAVLTRTPVAVNRTSPVGCTIKWHEDAPAVVAG